MTDQQVQAKVDEINGITGALNLGEGIEWMIKASFFEDNNMYISAKDAFKNAMGAEPNNQEFKNSYGLFLARIGLVDEAQRYVN